MLCLRVTSISKAICGSIRKGGYRQNKHSLHIDKMNEEKNVRLVALNNIWPMYIIESVARLPCRAVEGVLLVAAISSKVQQIETQTQCGRAQLFMILI